MTPDTSHNFSASYDPTTKAVSAVVCGAMLIVAVVSRNVVLAGVLALIVLLAYAYSPRGYSFSGRTLAVKRLFGDAEVPLDGLREARTAEPEDYRGCLRLWGSGGLFGYYGLFRTSRLGKCTWYVTNRSKAVLVVTDARTTLFSPDDPAGFLATLRTAAGVSAMPGRFKYGPATTDRTALMVCLLVLVAVVVGVAGFVALYNPGPPAYTLTPSDLTIHERFYPITVRAEAVDIANIRIVDFAVDRDWRPTARTNGFSSLHHHSGWFRAANGKRIWMYRGDGRRVVLLPPKGQGAPLLYEAKEPERFVAELRGRWSR